MLDLHKERELRKRVEELTKHIADEDKRVRMILTLTRQLTTVAEIPDEVEQDA
jgi:hypothetical protein